MLAGRDDVQAVQRVNNFVDLSVLTAGATPPNPQELLGRPALTNLLQVLNEAFDVILIDTPPAAGFADAHMLAARATRQAACGAEAWRGGPCGST